MLRLFLVLGLVGLSATGVWIWHEHQSRPEPAGEVSEPKGSESQVPLVTFEPPEDTPSGGGVLGMLGIVPEGLCDHCAANSCASTEQPVPEYPRAHLTKDADCEVRFYLDPAGKPCGIQAQCTEPEFVRAAERAVAKVRWPVTDINGDTCRRIGKTDMPILQTFEFRAEAPSLWRRMHRLLD